MKQKDAAGTRAAQISGLWFCQAIFGYVLTAFVIAILTSAHKPALAQDGWTELIVQTADAAPDGNGSFTIVDFVTLTDAGSPAFHGVLSGTLGGTLDDTGLFRSGGGTLYQIAREGQLTPGADGIIELLDFTNAQSNLGLGVFRANVLGSSTANDSGIFSGNGGQLSQVVRRGDAANFNGTFVSFASPLPNSSGSVAFWATLENTIGTDDRGIFRADGGAITEIVRRDDAAPFGGTFFEMSALAINNAGQTAFYADLANTSGAWDNSGIYRSGGGLITQIVREGQVAPDADGTFSDFINPSVAINNLGTVAFQGDLTGTLQTSGIFRGDGAGLIQVARTGQLAPDGNGTFDSFVRPVINDSNVAAFWAGITGTGTNSDAGIFLGNGYSISQVARAGQAAPDGNATFEFFGVPALTESGTTAFWASLKDASGSNNQGLYLGDDCDLIQVVRAGQQLSGSTVSSIRFLDGSGLFGGSDAGTVRSGLNNFGQVAYTAFLADGRQVIQTFTPDLHWREPLGGNWDSGSNWTLGLNPAEVHDVYIDSPASPIVYGPSNDTTVRSLQIGGGTGTSTLYLTGGAAITSWGGISIEATGQLTGDGTITGDTSNRGTIYADNITVNGTLINQHVIRGNGRLHAFMVNDVTGQIRADSGESLHLSGPWTDNFGLVRVIGGELVADSWLQNNAGTGLITARDATLEFRSGLNNDGSVGISFGTTDIFGDVANNTGAVINVSGGASATFYDDVVQNGALQVVAVGNAISTAVFFGELSGAGGFTGGGNVFALGDLRPGNSPASVLMDGNLFLGAATQTQIELGGLGLGEFDQLVVTGDLALAGDLVLDLIGGHVLTFNDEYLIADVGGDLFGQFSGLGEGDLVGNYGGMDLFISYSAGNGNDVALFTAVPEPRYLCVLVLLLSFLAGRRIRGRSSRHKCPAASFSP